jgi:hypothetical protein
MKLSQSNPYLKSAADWKATLRISAETSPAVEGIRAPFAKGRGTKAPAGKRAFIAHWKRRVASSVRAPIEDAGVQRARIGRANGVINGRRNR